MTEAKTKSLKKFLFIRLDKIGDLVCTLPCDEHPLFPEGSEKFWIINKGNEFIAKNTIPAKKFLSIDKKTPWKSFKTLIAFLSQNRFDVAFSFQSPWWVNMALMITGIRYRFGVLSQWHSFLFLNYGFRQKRSHAQKHEADYNYEIVSSALRKFLFKDKKIPAPPTPILKLKAAPNNDLWNRFELIYKNYVVIHPGMAGSALNWKQRQYIEFIDYLLQDPDKKIVITGTTMDEVYLTKIKEKFKNETRVLFLQDKVSTTELLNLLEGAAFLVAPSTGVLHLGASLGIPSFGIFSPIKVQHPIRWAARGPQVEIFVPKVHCPAKFKCLREKCAHFNCMDTIEPKMLFESVSKVAPTL